MVERKIRIIFSIIFLLMIVVPLCMINLKENTISIAENRVLASFPSLHNKDGTYNSMYTADFETWINDNIGLRSNMVMNNAKIQYYLFNVLSNNSDMYLGPEGEFNYASEMMLEDYQHLNIYPEYYTDWNAESLQIINDYLEQKGIQFYYYQCWDKHSIYPEYFPDSVIQYGDLSKTDILISKIKTKTTVKTISIKDELILQKKNYQIFSRWGDPSHWTQRGSYIGYLELMKVLNENNNSKLRVLNEGDYNISITDQGMNLFGGIHKTDLLEHFEIKKPSAVLCNNKLKLYANDPRHSYYLNNDINNSLRMLIIGDSYFNGFIVDDIAESFHETILIWGDYTRHIKSIIEVYQPDIVILEAAERVDRSNEIIAAAEIIQDIR